jgi:glycosyltransferase involved in cell wall biosynthesis
VSRRLPPLRRLTRRLSPLRDSQLQVFDFSATIAAVVRRVARRKSIDIIEMEESFGWCADVARRTSLPMVVRLHGPAFLSLIGSELETPFAREKIEREGEALRNCPTITSPTAHTLTQTIDRYHLEAEHTLHVVNPLTTHPDTPLWRLEDCDRDMILFVGRFDLRKGADVVLQAFHTVVKRHPRVMLTFIGPDIGLPSPEGGRIQIKQYCDSLFSDELRGRIDYRGPMSNDEVARFRTRAMVTVVPSRWENPGYSVLEAMLQGCPLVCTDAGGCPESVIHGVTGRLARSTDPDDFAEQICAVLDNPTGAVTMGEAARQHVLERHSPAQVAAESLSLYAKLIGSRAR